MDSTLTVRHLLGPGEPLEASEVLAGESRLSNPVTWVVSLRPYAPALPQLRGGELALVAVEHLTRFDPPLAMASVIMQLASRDAAGVAVRGEVDRPAIEAARQADLPLLRLSPDAPLHDIEQAIMRECALHQARREMQPPPDPGVWIDDLLDGRSMSSNETQEAVRRPGYNLAAPYSLAYLSLADETWSGEKGPQEIAHEIEEELRKVAHAKGEAPIVRLYGGGIVILFPPATAGRLLGAIRDHALPCGISRERPLLQASVSLAEARMAAVASARLHEGALTHYSRLRADRLLLMLHQEHANELEAFVEETLGPLLRHDARSAVPLLPTVQSFIEHGSRLRETAADIYIHRNTLAYRLDRAAEILGVDLKEPGTRLAVELALRALPLVRRPTTDC